MLTGLDLSASSITKAQDLAEGTRLNISFIAEDADNLNCDNEYDVIFCRSFLQYLSDVRERKNLPTGDK